MSFHTEVLSDEQLRILPCLASFASAQGFYLGGGTAVALYLGHRTSLDFDWFSRKDMGDPLLLAQSARRSGLASTDIQTAPGTLHMLVDGVRISFFEYPYAEVDNALVLPEFSLELASLDDLGCMKLAAIAQRGSRKDFVDLFFIATEHKPIEEILHLYCQKYSTSDIGHILVGLTYFDDADDEPSLVMLREASWDNIKREFQQWSRVLAG